MSDIEKTLAQNIRANSLADYQANRYGHIPDGEILTFNNEDFSGLDFGNFNMGFWSFINCDLRNSRAFSGQPIALDGCKLNGADFRGVSTVIHAKNSDFSGAKFDDETCIYDSMFTGCALDDEFKAKIISAGGKIS